MSKNKEMIKEKDTVNEKKTGRSKALTVVGILLCVILVPILVVNVTMIVKSYIKPDEYPSFAGYNLMIVLSPSMEDTIMKGDLIVVKNAEPDEVKGESSAGAQDGTIISFFDPDSSKQSVLTHRCKSIQADGSFITKGDNNISEDPTPCPAENLIGTYITRIPGAGSVAMWLQTPVGLIVCVAVPIVLLVAYDLIMKKRFDKKKKNDTDALLAELEELRAQTGEDTSGNKEEAKAGAADERAKEKEAPKKNVKAPSYQEEKPVEPAGKRFEADADDSVTTTMSAEELEQFREFQRMKAQRESDKKDSGSQDEE